MTKKKVSRNVEVPAQNKKFEGFKNTKRSVHANGKRRKGS